MPTEINRTKISESIFFTSIQNKKFKSNRISVNLFVPLAKETAAANAIIPMILRKGYSECPDSAQFVRLLNSLYGASVGYNIGRLGDNQYISLSISAIDDKYTLNGEETSTEISRLLCSLILDPVIENGSFCQKTFEAEKKSLIDTIKAELNDKASYALTRCQEIMCDGQPYAVGAYGSLEGAKALTCRQAFDAYSNLLERARIEIIFTGCSDAVAAKDIFTSSFTSSVKRKDPYKIISEIAKNSGDVKDKYEEFSVAQAKLCMGFTCDTEKGDADECAVNFMCAVFGTTPFSKLFLNVREKLSLCYYCSSAYDHFKGIIFVKSGIEAENKETAKKEILKQLEAIQNGEISEEEIENTKKLYYNILNGVEDSIKATENFFLSRLVCDQTETVQDEIDKIGKITAEDIINAARKVKLDTVYFMKPKENAADE